MYNQNSETYILPQNQGNNQIPSYQQIPKIRVIVRKRPLNKKELMRNDQSVVEIRNNKQVVVKELKQKVDLTKYIEEHTFNFDMAFDQDQSNETIYMQTVRPMIEAAFNKTKVTCFAYGQTGSGKTYTMMGSNMSENNINPGLYLLAAFDIFRLLQLPQYQGFSINASFYEIYCNKIYDLLNERKSLNAREDGKQNICIVGLVEKKVNSLNELMGIINFGLKGRTVGTTGANNDSSRSHAIIQITIKNYNDNMHGKISFIDLAGSERAADVTDTNKQTRIDGAAINQSLLALKECIRALDQNKKHAPFRGSTLTLVLRDSFIGNAKTLMIANISPSLVCSEHTLNTLRYADRVKELRGKPDITLGSGNVNLNFDPALNEKNKQGKDPQEILSNLLMMPRDHKNTVKYNVDNNMNRLSENKPKKKAAAKKVRNSSNCGGNLTNQLLNSASFSQNNFGFNQMNNTQQIDLNATYNYGMQNNLNSSMNMGYNNNMNYNINSYPSNQTQQINPNQANPNNMNINNNINIFSGQNQPTNQINFLQPAQPFENKENLSSNFQYLSSKKAQNPKPAYSQTVSMSEKVPSLVNSLLDNNNQNPAGSNAFAFLNDYTSYNQQKDERIPNSNQNESDENYEKLKEKYENLVNQILTEEKEIIEVHKKHVDGMVEKIKMEMSFINSMENQNDIDSYIGNGLKVFDYEIEKITAMKEKFKGFQALFNEEAELNLKLSSYYNNQINSGNQVNQTFGAMENDVNEIDDLNECQMEENNQSGNKMEEEELEDDENM